MLTVHAIHCKDSIVVLTIILLLIGLERDVICEYNYINVSATDITCSVYRTLIYTKKNACYVSNRWQVYL